MSHILQVVLQAWFYFCPIIYSLDFVPARYRILFRLNPLLYPLNGFRLAIYYGLLPSPVSMVISLGCGIAALVIGYKLFQRWQDTLVFYV
jgi:ABC-type polysaccharide/polyol phosphate export permease